MQIAKDNFCYSLSFDFVQPNSRLGLVSSLASQPELQFPHYPQNFIISSYFTQAFQIVPFFALLNFRVGESPSREGTGYSRLQSDTTSVCLSSDFHTTNFRNC